MQSDAEERVLLEAVVTRTAVTLPQAQEASGLSPLSSLWWYKRRGSAGCTAGLSFRPVGPQAAMSGSEQAHRPLPLCPP